MNSAEKTEASNDFNWEKTSNWIHRWEEVFQEEVEWLPVAV